MTLDDFKDKHFQLAIVCQWPDHIEEIGSLSYYLEDKVSKRIYCEACVGKIQLMLTLKNLIKEFE